MIRLSGSSGLLSSSTQSAHVTWKSARYLEFPDSAATAPKPPFLREVTSFLLARDHVCLTGRFWRSFGDWSLLIASRGGGYRVHVPPSYPDHSFGTYLERTDNFT